MESLERWSHQTTAFAESKTFDLDVYGVIMAKGRIEGGRRGLRDGKETLKLDGRGLTGAIKSQELNGGTMGSK